MKAKHINVTNVNEQDMNESLNKYNIELDIEFQISKIMNCINYFGSA